MLIMYATTKNTYIKKIQELRGRVNSTKKKPESFLEVTLAKLETIKTTLQFNQPPIFVQVQFVLSPNKWWASASLGSWLVMYILVCSKNHKIYDYM